MSPASFSDPRERGSRAETVEPGRTLAAPDGLLGRRTGSQSLVGATVDGRYEILEVLGQGGMGTVYKARHLMLDEVVAFKVIHDALAENGEVRERFLREAKATLRFVHPNVIPMRDFGVTTDGMLYMTLDFSTGKSLRMLLREQGRLGTFRALAIVRQCLLALREAHARGIVHRDLKPDNILIERNDATGEDVARICDFGMAKILKSCMERDADASMTGFAAIGTPHYMAPEQATGESADARTDIYAIGCILYELVTGTRVFSASSASQILMKHITHPPEPPSRRAGGISPRLEALILRALQKDPDDRPACADDFIEALDGLLTHHRATRRLRVLLAEDNRVSQRMAARILERWGHAVTVAADGREALAHLERERFDVVLMDGDMPGLDGFEATAELRAREAGTDERTPVIALTAHDATDDRERCLAAGMDGYLAKPIRNDELFDTIERATRPRAKAEESAVDDDSGLDAAAALARVEGDSELLAELAVLFLAEFPRLLDSMRAAVKSGDAAALARAAHELKGAAANCSATRVSDAASWIEDAAHAADHAKAADLIARLERELVKLRPALAAVANARAA